jgi:tetratricopeptide (TPR) repeat protein
MVQIAGSYHDLGDYAKVELFSAKAKSTLEADRLTKCYAFAQALNYLALCFDQKGDFADAENVSRTALSVYHCCVSKDHFVIGQELSILGAHCYRQSKFEEGESFLQQSLQVKLNSLPAQHPNIVSCECVVLCTCFQQSVVRQIVHIIEVRLKT